MAGDWIKMRTALADDPAVIAMADQLNTDEFSVVGRLHHLWGWADTQSRDGHAKGVTQKWINRYVRCDGFAEAMISVGWLVNCEDGIQFPNFDRHNGESAKARGLASNRKQKQRANVTDESSELSRTERDISVTREEKRREELEAEASASLPAAPSPVLTSEKDVSGDKPETLQCPIQKIIDLYHECLPANPKVRLVDEERKRSIRSRWQQAAKLVGVRPFGYDNVAAGLAAWREFFEVCADSEFLTGRARAQPGKVPFVADIDFLVSPKGFKRALENKYHEVYA